MIKSFIQWNRNKEVIELMRKPDCFMLLSQIAFRARRTNDFNINNLKSGEALIGDYKSIGLTEQRYKTAKSNLQKWSLATFKATNKGTIAKLVDTRIYDINEKQTNDQTNQTTTSQQRTTNEPATTNKNDKNDKKSILDKKPKKFIKPKLEEVKKYCLERKNNVDPERFMNSNESKGWVVGKSPMKDWKASVRTWEGNNFDSGKNITSSKFIQKPLTEDERRSLAYCKAKNELAKALGTNPDNLNKEQLESLKI